MSKKITTNIPQINETPSLPPYNSFGMVKTKEGWIVIKSVIEGNTVVHSALSEPELRSMAIDRLKVDIVNEIYKEV